MNQQSEQRKPLSAKGMVFIAIMLALLAGLVHYLFAEILDFNTREYEITDTGRGVDYDYSSGASFYSNDARFFYFCTRDGMQYISSGGRVEWTEPMHLTRPIMTAYGDMVAVGEEKGRRIYVFDNKGLAYELSFPSPVLTFSVNPTGFLSVVVQLDQGYGVYIYSRSQHNSPIYENVIRDPNIIPTSVSVSQDGRYAAIALLDYGMRLYSRVLFSYINASDARDSADGVFAGDDYENNEIAHTVRFMDDDQVLVFTDTQIICYKTGDRNVSEQWRIPLHNRISPLAFYGGSLFAFAAGDRFLNDERSAEPGEVHIYDMSGSRTGTFRLGRKVTYLSMGHRHVIIGGDRSFYVLTPRGDIQWTFQTLHDTRAFIFLDNTDTVLIAGGTKASVMKKTRKRAAQIEAENLAEPLPGFENPLHHP